MDAFHRHFKGSRLTIKRNPRSPPQRSAHQFDVGVGKEHILSGLLDQFGRTATDLRISLIDKCNLRCHYCMPAEGLDWLKKDDLLAAHEIVRLADIAIRHLGIQEIRFTGGEPLVRADLVDILDGVHSKHPDIDLSMTTNGINLERKIDDLVAAGLSRINVSLDTVCPETFAEITRRDRLTKVLSGLHAAKAAGLHPIKINAVLLRGINDQQAAELLTWTLEHGYNLRFIEQMPLDADHKWTRDNMVTAAEIRAQISQVYDLAPHEEPRGSAPAELFDVKDPDTHEVLGTVGIIASVTEPFCAACTRTRLTADAKIRSCLFSHTETDLMELLRDGSDDDAIADAWREAMWHKPKAHGQTKIGLGMPGFVQPERTMSAIGG